jgi:hypothetical protein
MSMAGNDLSRSIQENYQAFSRQAARGRSRPYEILAAEVARDPVVLAFLASLPPAKRQPNLVFAAAWYLLGRPAGIGSLRAVLRCEPAGPVPLPGRVPAVRWRAGLDLNPLDVTSDADVHWLGCLLWPGERGRRQRLASAVAAARRDPAPVYRGDLLTDLAALASRAPAGATLVIYHSAVLGYLSEAGRGQFAEIVRGLDAVWLSNEPAQLLGVTAPAASDSSFQIVRDGHTLLAVTDPHGSWLRWLA